MSNEKWKTNNEKPNHGFRPYGFNPISEIRVICGSVSPYRLSVVSFSFGCGQRPRYVICGSVSHYRLSVVSFSFGCGHRPRCDLRDLGELRGLLSSTFPAFLASWRFILIGALRTI